MLNLLSRLDTFHSLDATVNHIISKKEPCMVSFLNAHAVNLSYKNSLFKTNLVKSDILLRDGIGVKIACYLHNIAPGLNLNGTDLIPCLINESIKKDYKVFFFGASQQTIDLLKPIYLDQGVVKHVFLNGFKSDEEYVEILNRDSIPTGSLVVLGMGMPKQELLSSKLKMLADNKTIIVCGGAILDRLSGRVSRGPKIFSVVGLEWLYRLLMSPRRLFGRYVLGNPIFLLRSLWSMIRLLLKTTKGKLSLE